MKSMSKDENITFVTDHVTRALVEWITGQGRGGRAEAARLTNLSETTIKNIVDGKVKRIKPETWDALYDGIGPPIPRPPWRKEKYEQSEKAVGWLESITSDFYFEFLEGLDRINFPDLFEAMVSTTAALAPGPPPRSDFAPAPPLNPDFENHLKNEYQKHRDIPDEEEWSWAVVKIWKILTDTSHLPWQRPSAIKVKAFSALADAIDSFEVDSADIDNIFNFIRNWLSSNEKRKEPDYDTLEQKLCSLCDVFSDEGPHLKESSMEKSKIPGLGPRLQAARESAGLTLEAAAEKLDVLPGFLEAWEAGRSDPPVDVLLKIIKLYKVAADHLLTGKPAPAGLETAVLEILRSDPGKQWTVDEITQCVNELIKSGQLKIQAN